ncbi:MAG: hypothetical protein ACLFUR_01690 [Candidatus Hadarchaeia archaeon]
MRSGIESDRGLVTSGLALLLIIPSLILSVAFIGTMETGAEGTAVRGLSTRASFTADDYERALQLMKNNEVMINEDRLKSLAEAYTEQTGFRVEATLHGSGPGWENVGIEILDNVGTVHYEDDFIVMAEGTSEEDEEESETTDSDDDEEFVHPDEDEIDQEISAPFSKDGEGEFWWKAEDLGNNINSWDVETLEVNGEDFTEEYAFAEDLPEKVDGYWYVRYVGNSESSHFEANS